MENGIFLKKKLSKICTQTTKVYEKNLELGFR